MSADVFYQIVSEVKKTAKPWVVFKQPKIYKHNLGMGWRNLVFTSGIPGARVVDGLPIKSTEFPRAFSSGLASQLGWVGYGIHEAFKSPRKASRWYSAMLSACKAGEYQLKANSWEPSDEEGEKAEPHIFFIQPTIILDGLMYSAELDRSAEIRLRKIDFATVDFKFASSSYRRGGYHVNVVRLDSLDEDIGSCEKQHQKRFDVRVGACVPGKRGDVPT